VSGSTERISLYTLLPVEEEATEKDRPFSDESLGHTKKLSVVVPVYNEEDSIRNVVEDLEETLSSLGMQFEIIVVNDGSTDNTLQSAQLLQEHCHLRVISYRANRGKTAAMMAGFHHAEGDYIVLMDGDGQFLAKDIPKMVKRLEEGCDVVNGWGKKKEPITKTIPSLIYNFISRKLFSLNVHQFNLGYKAFKKECIENLILMKDEHRYILPLLKEQGFTIEEVPVEYLPRENGTSKYGIMRIPYGVLDMVSLKIEMVCGERPFRIFGLISLGLILLGGLLGIYTVLEWIRGMGITMWNVVFSLIFLLSGINILFAGYAVESAKNPRR